MNPLRPIKNFQEITDQSNDTQNEPNSYLCNHENSENSEMIKRIKELYKEFKPYVRVDLIMYGFTILMILLYVLISSLS